MNLIVVDEFKIISGSKYVLTNNGIVLIDDISKQVNCQSGIFNVNYISDVYITSEMFEILQRKPICSIDLNRVKCICEQFVPTSNGISVNSIWVKIHWTGYKNKNNEDYTVEDFNSLGIRNKKPGKGKGINRLSLDSNQFMRQIMCMINPMIREINNKVSSKKKSAIYLRTSVEKESKIENSLESQFECNLSVSKDNDLLINDVLIHDGKSGGGKYETTPNTYDNLFQEFIRGDFNTLIVKFPHRLCRKVSVFLEIFENLKSKDRNILSLISNPVHPKYGSIIDTNKDIELNKYSKKDIEVLKDRENFYTNPLPDSLYMSLINKSIFMIEMHEAETTWEHISAEGKRNADLKKKRKHAEENFLDDLKKLKSVINTNDTDKIKAALRSFK